MRLIGIDFTSAPRAAKPMVAAVCRLHGGEVIVEDLLPWADWEGFEHFLQQEASATTALDLPLGLPSKFVAAQAWPTDWSGYVRHVAEMGREAFLGTVERFRRQQPPGHAHPRRRTDQLAGAGSPLMVHGVPLAKMFYEGARRLLAAPVSILPCRPAAGDHRVVEGYPGILVRRLIGRTPYKADDRARQSVAHRDARQNLLQICTSARLEGYYGLRVRVDREAGRAVVADPTGDALDALLCAIQAGWAIRQHDPPLGIPADAPRQEGWIVDPALLLRPTTEGP
jgi:hypothetical protein